MLSTCHQSLVRGAVSSLCQDLVSLQQGRRQTEPLCLPEYRLWKELVACILGSRAPHRVAQRALDHLDSIGLIHEGQSGRHLALYETAVARALGSPDSRFPFAQQRAKWIRRAAFQLYSRGSGIRSLLREGADARAVRRLMAVQIPGIGLKQASLYLRNIGYSQDMAILDTHVLSYMEWLGISTAETSVPRSTAAYEALEELLSEHVQVLGASMSTGDLAIWVVVRVVKREMQTWLS